MIDPRQPRRLHNYADLMRALMLRRVTPRTVVQPIPAGLGTNEAGPKVQTNPTPNAWSEDGDAN